MLITPVHSPTGFQSLLSGSTSVRFFCLILPKPHSTYWLKSNRTSFRRTCFARSNEFADFGSGVLHWSVDNYGNGRTPVMGNIIAAFQGHHSAPWTITYRGFCNNVWKLCIPFGLPTVAAINYVAGPEHSMGKLTLNLFVFSSLSFGIILKS